MNYIKLVGFPSINLSLAVFLQHASQKCSRCFGILSTIGRIHINTWPSPLLLHVWEKVTQINWSSLYCQYNHLNLHPSFSLKWFVTYRLSLPISYNKWPLHAMTKTTDSSDQQPSHSVKYWTDVECSVWNARTRFRFQSPNPFQYFREDTK